jgi:hypothetical protein
MISGGFVYLNESVEALVGDDDGANLKIPGVDEYIVAVNQTPLVSTGRGAEVILAIVLDPLATIPIFVPDLMTPLPLMMLDIFVLVVIVMVPVAVLRKNQTT